MKEYQVEGIVDTLCSNMAADKEQLRDISSIGIFAKLLFSMILKYSPLKSSRNFLNNNNNNDNNNNNNNRNISTG